MAQDYIYSAGLDLSSFEDSLESIHKSMVDLAKQGEAAFAAIETKTAPMSESVKKVADTTQLLNVALKEMGKTTNLSALEKQLAEVVDELQIFDNEIKSLEKDLVKFTKTGDERLPQVEKKLAEMKQRATETREEYNKLAQAVQAAKIKEALDTVAKSGKFAISEIDEATRELNNALGVLRSTGVYNIEQLGESSQSVGTIMEGAIIGAASRITDYLINMARTAVNQIKAVVQEAIDINKQFETYGVQFTTFLKSEDLANQTITDLQKFNIATPFELPELVEGAKLLQTFGSAQLNVMENWKLVGDAAASVNQPFQSVAMWVGRIYGDIQNGRPFGEAAMRLGEMGIMSGALRQKLEGMRESGADATEIWKVFTNEIGTEFEGGAERLSKTLGGIESNLSDFQTNLLRVGGEAYFEQLKDESQAILDTLSDEDMAAALENLAVQLGEMAARAREFMTSGLLETFGETEPEKIDNFANALQDLNDVLGKVPNAGSLDGGFINDSIELLTSALDLYTSVTLKINEIKESATAVGAGFTVFSEGLKTAGSELAGALFPPLKPLQKLVEGFSLLNDVSETLTGTRVSEWLRDTTDAMSDQTEKQEALNKAYQEYAAARRADDAAAANAEKARIEGLEGDAADAAQRAIEQQQAAEEAAQKATEAAAEGKVEAALKAATAAEAAFAEAQKAAIEAQKIAADAGTDVAKQSAEAAQAAMQVAGQAAIAARNMANQAVAAAEQARVEAAQEKIDSKMEDLARQHTRKMASIMDDYHNKQIDAQKDFARKRESIERSYQRSVEDINRKYAQQIAEVSDFSATERQLATKHRQELAQLERDAANERLQIEKDYQRQLQQIQNQYAQDSEEAARANNASAFLAARRQRNRAVEEATIDRDQKQADAAQEFAQRREALLAAQQQEISDAREAAQQKLADLREKMQEELAEAERKRQQDIEDAKIAEERKSADLDEEISRRVQAEIEANNERIADAQRALSKELEIVRGTEQQKQAAIQQTGAVAQIVANQSVQAWQTAGNAAMAAIARMQAAAQQAQASASALSSSIPYSQQSSVIQRRNAMRGLEGISGRAFGGTVLSNRPYLVGERGPELFTPNQTGQITPNNRLMSSPAAFGMGGAVTYNQQRVDLSMLDPSQVSPAQRAAMRQEALAILAEL